MARHARTCSAAGSHGPAHAPAHTPPRETAPRRCDPVLLGVLTTAADFAALARRIPVRHPDYRSYLAELGQALDRLRRIHPAVYGRRFHLADLDRFCAQHGLDRDAPGSHGAYTESPEGEPAWVRWTGQPLPVFLAALDRAHLRAGRRAMVHARLDRMLVETAEAAPTGAFPAELLRPAYGAASRAVHTVLLSASPGPHRLACALHPDDGSEPVELCVELETGPGGRPRMDDAALDARTAAMCTAHALRLSARLLLAGDGLAAVRGWFFDGSELHRRSAPDLLYGLSGRLLGELAAPLEI
jgi:hypothetical protein